MNDDLARFRGNCFQFACDKLDPDEHAWMLQMLERHPALQAEVEAERELVRLAREGLAQHAKPLVSFDQISSLLAEHEQRRQRSLAGRLAAWWRQLSLTPASNGHRWAVAALVTLGVALVFQGRQLVERDAIPDDGYRAVQPAGQGQSGILRVKFRQDVALGGLAARLEAMHLHIRSGPDVNGVYELSASGVALSEAVSQLRESGLATQIDVLDIRQREDR